MKKAVLAAVICLTFAPQVFARGGGHGGGHSGSHSSGRSHSVSHGASGSHNTSRSHERGARSSHPIAKRATGVVVRTLTTQAAPRAKPAPTGSQAGNYNRTTRDEPMGKPAQTAAGNAAEVKRVDPTVAPCPPTCIAPQTSPKTAAPV